MPRSYGIDQEKLLRASESYLRDKGRAGRNDPDDRGAESFNVLFDRTYKSIAEFYRSALDFCPKVHRTALWKALCTDLPRWHRDPEGGGSTVWRDGRPAFELSRAEYQTGAHSGFALSPSETDDIRERVINFLNNSELLTPGGTK